MIAINVYMINTETKCSKNMYILYENNEDPLKSKLLNNFT